MGPPGWGQFSKTYLYSIPVPLVAVMKGEVSDPLENLEVLGHLDPGGERGSITLDP